MEYSKIMEQQINSGVRKFIDRNLQKQSKNNDKPLSSGLKHLALKQGNETQNSTRMPWIKRIFTDPCKSASSAQSVFFRTDSRIKSTGDKVSALICVPPRFFFNANFQYYDTLSRELAEFQNDEYRSVKLICRE